MWRHGNLLAFEDTEKHRIGSDEALKLTMQWIAVGLNQVAQVEQLFEPLPSRCRACTARRPI